MKEKQYLVNLILSESDLNVLHNALQMSLEEQKRLAKLYDDDLNKPFIESLEKILETTIKDSKEITKITTVYKI